MARAVTLRLQAKDADQVIAALRATGQSGDRMADRLERAGKKGSRGLRAVDRAASGLRSRFASFASRIPIVGESLAAIGPAGLAAGAGVAALALGLQRGIRVAREALRAFDALAKKADDLALSTDALQGLRAAATDESVELNRLNQALNIFTINSSRAATGRGEMVEKLRQSHPELLREIQLLESNEDRLSRVAEALRETTSERDFQILANAAFGESGLAVARVLARQEDGLAGMIARARESGRVVDEFILRRAEQMENRLGVAAQVIDTELKTAFVALAPVLVNSAELMADIATAVRRLADAFQTLENRTTEGLEGRLDDLREMRAGIEETEEADLRRMGRIAAMRDGLRGGELGGAALLNYGRRALSERISELDEEIAAIETILDRRAQEAGTGSGGGDGDGAPPIDPERVAMEREAAQVRAELGDISALLAQREERLNALVEAGFLTRDQAAASLERYRDSLDETSEAEDRARQITEAMRTPIEIYHERLAELTRLREADLISQEVWTRAVTAARAALDRANPAAREAAEIRAALASEEERYAAELARVNALVDEGLLLQEEAAEHMARYREELESAGDGLEHVRFEMELLDSILAGQIESWDDLGRVALKILSDIAREALEAADATQGLGAFLTQVLSGFAEGLGFSLSGGSASPPASSSAAGGGFNLGGGGPLFATSSSAPAMASASAAPAAAGASAERVVIHNYSGGEVEVGERRSPGGGRELQIMVGRAVKSQIRGGEFDGVMRDRFSLNATPGGGGR